MSSVCAAPAAVHACAALSPRRADSPTSARAQAARLPPCGGERHARPRPRPAGYQRTQVGERASATLCGATRPLPTMLIHTLRLVGA